MFKLQPAPTFPASVTITELDGTEQTLEIVYKHCPASKLEAVFEKHDDGSAAHAMRFIESVSPACKDVGQSDVDFLKELFDQRPWVFGQLLQTWVELLGQGRRKN